MGNEYGWQPSISSTVLRVWGYFTHAHSNPNTRRKNSLSRRKCRSTGMIMLGITPGENRTTSFRFSEGETSELRKTCTGPRWGLQSGRSKWWGLGLQVWAILLSDPGWRTGVYVSLKNTLCGFADGVIGQQPQRVSCPCACGSGETQGSGWRTPLCSCQ